MICFNCKTTEWDWEHEKIHVLRNCSKTTNSNVLMVNNNEICFWTIYEYINIGKFQPIGYLEKNWMKEEFSGGCYTSVLPPGVLTSMGR
jgi:hypothetical protein